MANNTYDWIGLMERTKKAHTPTFGQTTLQPFGQAVGQGMAGRQIGQDELRKAIFTALLGKNIPMVGEEPATMEQMMGAMRGKPGVIPSLFGAKEPPELTWKPIETEWKAKTKEDKLELIKAGKTDPKEFEYILKSALQEQKHTMELELTKLKAELTGPLDEARRGKLVKETEQIDERLKMFKSEEPGKESWTDRFINSILEKVLGTKRPTAETPTEQIELGLEETPTPTPTETLLPDWLPEEVKVRVKALQEAGASEEEIQEIINYYRQ